MAGGKDTVYGVTAEAPTCRVQVALTPIGPWVLGMQAHHTSVLLNNVEYYFTRSGIVVGTGTQSHAGFARGGNDTFIVDVGYAYIKPVNFEMALRPFFLPETYDLLRKNCNSFTDCALSFLSGVRLDTRYKVLESIALAADRYLLVVQGLSGGAYTPNPRSDNFEADEVARELGRMRSAMATSTMRGPSVDTPLCTLVWR
uniref:PPPDE domain-containing protein n=1 Tax=Zooxanthella nutricula TaxID=1333877 RepID=A0A7S2QAB6_9DINO